MCSVIEKTIKGISNIKPHHWDESNDNQTKKERKEGKQPNDIKSVFCNFCLCTVNVHDIKDDECPVCGAWI